MTAWPALLSQRALPVGALVLAVAAALSARYGLEGLWAKYLGVALWTVCVYALVLVVRPAIRVSRAVLLAWAISWCVEFAQLTCVPAWLSSQHIVLGWIFGSSFSIWDLPVYPAGAGLGAAFHLLLVRLGLSRPVITSVTE